MKFIQNKTNLKNKWVFITGASGFLGKKISLLFAECGSNLIILDINKSKCESLKKQIKKKYNVKIKIYNCDLENENQRNELIKNIKSNTNKIDIMINNASMVGTSAVTGWSASFEKQSLSSWRKAIEINVTSIFHLIQGLKVVLNKNKGSSIINISSIYGLYAPDKRLYKNTNILFSPAAYAVSKGGLIQLTRWLSTSLAPKIRVNSIAPGGILRNQGKNFILNYNAGTPLGRMAKEEDMLGGIYFLATDLSSYITGQIITIDGGRGVW